MKVDVFNKENTKVGTVELPSRIFDVAWNSDLVSQVLKAQQANKREPWAHTKDRSEVSGGGKKPWRQKGTGRARHGSIRSPIWRGGGKAHGPTKERSYSQKINKKMLQGAIFSVLSKKLRDGEVRIYDELGIEKPKTNLLLKMLRAITDIPASKKKLDILILVSKERATIITRAASNLQKTKVISPKSINVYDVLNYKKIFIEQDTIPVIDEHYSATKK